MDQIEFYCTKIEELSGTHPHVAASIERCALEAVTTLCQVGSPFVHFLNVHLVITYFITFLAVFKKNNIPLTK